MARVNTVLVFFLLLFAALSAAAWAFLQSRSFGQLLSRAVTEISSKQFDTKVRFSRVGIHFFPPGLSLENVSLRYERQGTRIDAEAGSLGVVFDLRFYSQNKLHLGEVYLSEGFADLRFEPSTTESTHPWDLIQSELKKLPIDVGTIRITDSRISVLETTVDAHHLELNPGPEVVTVDAELKLIKHQSMPSSVDVLRIRADVKREVLTAKTVQVMQKSSKLLASGVVENWADRERLRVAGNFESELFVPDLHEWGDLPVVRLESGVLRAKGEFRWSAAEKFAGRADLVVSGLRSNVAVAQRIEAQAEARDQRIFVSQFRLRNNDEKLELIEPAVLVDLANDRLLPNALPLRADKLSLSNALSVLGPALAPLKGTLTGNLLFRLKGQDLFFTPAKGFQLDRLRLDVDGDGENNIIDAPVVWLEDTELMVVNGTFVVKGQVRAPLSQVEVEGFVSRDEVRVDAKASQLSLTDFGDVAGLGLKGRGANTIRARGPLEKVKLSFEGELREFEVLGYRLGNVQQRVTLNLADGSVDLASVSARKGRYDFSGSGVVNYKNFLLDLSVDIPGIAYSEFKDAIHPLADGLAFLPEDFDGQLQGAVGLYAKGDIASLAVVADVYAQKLVAGGEQFRDAKFSFRYANRDIALKNISVTKESGKLTGEVGYDLARRQLSYNLSLRGLASDELGFYKRSPLALSFRSVGEFQGQQTPSRWRHRGYLGLTQSRIHERLLPDSTFEWDLRDDAVFADLKVARDWVLLSANSFKEKVGPTVDAELSVNLPDLPLFLRGLLGENSQLTASKGELSLASRIRVTNWEWNRLTAGVWLKTLRLQTPEISVDQRFDARQVEITDGDVKRWALQIDSGDLKVSSTARGELRNRIVIANDVDVDAKYLELLSRHVSRADGRVRAKSRHVLSERGVDSEGEVSARDLTLSTELLPFSLTDLAFKLHLKNREVELEQLSFRPDAGRVSATGTMLLAGINPDLNFRFVFDRATVPFKSKSSVTLSGEALLFGNRPPYLLSGDLVVNAGAVRNELTDFAGSGPTATDAKYLPKDADAAFAGLVTVDVGVRTENPVVVSNSMLDLSLAGGLQLTGDPSRIAAEGKIATANNQSKVFFKNSEYQVTKADFSFSNRRPITRPDFDIEAGAIIANYKVTAKAFGSPENFSFDLSSDPALSKQNILSLIAFGYTEDLSNSITAEERRNLTNVGVGSFIFDQFKVTDIVKKQFGLQVNMGTVFEQSQESMLQGRTQDAGAGTLARTRTATNIEVKKRLSEAMSLSVSSTVGGSIGQRQRMNLNYGLSRSVQLEGIYELRTNAEGTEDVIDNSIGGDVKFRMTFK